ncbi:hypothetical protein NC652_013804 [Populus alba x Populus x berolinensis]|nr:hypothetical protein NC652_013804 [Populus alba x Populus x berolinensis]
MGQKKCFMVDTLHQLRCPAIGEENILANTALKQYVVPAMIGLREAQKTANVSVLCPLRCIPPSSAYFETPVLPIVLPI